MAVIKLITLIERNIELIFDLSQSINLHIITTAKTQEKAIGGTTRG